MVILVAATAACGLSGSSDGPAGLAVPPKQVQVDARRVNGLGTILVTSAGHVLYMFPPDSRQKVTCTGGCAGTWPPVRIAPGGRVVAGSGITQHLLGTVPDPDLGGDVVTYNGWPLYTYEGDVDAGQATGQALNLDGAPWYVLRTSGAPLISASPATGAGS
jgi:predicted lipoprotein with Yx(FWY)xxD motif